MDHDSHIDCNEIKRLSLVDINAEINADAGCLKGEISDDVRAKIVEAINSSPGLTPNEKERYIAALNTQ